MVFGYANERIDNKVKGRWTSEHFTLTVGTRDFGKLLKEVVPCAEMSRFI